MHENPSCGPIIMSLPADQLPHLSPLPLWRPGWVLINVSIKVLTARKGKRAVMTKRVFGRVGNSDRVIISRVAMGLSVTRDVVRRLGYGFDALRKATDCMTGREHVAHVFIDHPC